MVGRVMYGTKRTNKITPRFRKSEKSKKSENILQNLNKSIMNRLTKIKIEKEKTKTNPNTTKSNYKTITHTILAPGKSALSEWRKSTLKSDPYLECKKELNHTEHGYDKYIKCMKSKLQKHNKHNKYKSII
jgi:hypothetical protein